MTKQFKDKNELDDWIAVNFPAGSTNNFFEMPEEPDMEIVAAKLEAEGYDLDNLTANGEGYEINGHINNGWFWAYKSDLQWLKSVGTDMSKVKVRD